MLPPLIEGQSAVTVRYGAFLQTVFDFIIVAFAIFIAVKAINRVRRAEQAAAPPAPAAPPREQVLLEEIRDLLKQNR
jgi:large conductance mechanosensitive channel